MFELETSEIPPSTLISELSSMVGNDKYSDVVIYIEGKPIYAHKLILSRSTYFEAMFSGQMIESCSREITINNISYKTF